MEIIITNQFIVFCKDVQTGDKLKENIIITYFDRSVNLNTVMFV